MLLVDADVDLRNNIESYLAMQQDIQPVGVTGDGAQAEIKAVYGFGYKLLFDP